MLILGNSLSLVSWESTESNKVGSKKIQFDLGECNEKFSSVGSEQELRNKLENAVFSDAPDLKIPLAWVAPVQEILLKIDQEDKKVSTFDIELLQNESINTPYDLNSMHKSKPASVNPQSLECWSSEEHQESDAGSSSFIAILSGDKSECFAGMRPSVIQEPLAEHAVVTDLKFPQSNRVLVYRNLSSEYSKREALHFNSDEHIAQISSNSLDQLDLIKRSIKTISEGASVSLPSAYSCFTQYKPGISAPNSDEAQIDKSILAPSETVLHAISKIIAGEIEGEPAVTDLYVNSRSRDGEILPLQRNYIVGENAAKGGSQFEKSDVLINSTEQLDTMSMHSVSRGGRYYEHSSPIQVIDQGVLRLEDLASATSRNVKFFLKDSEESRDDHVLNTLQVKGVTAGRDHRVPKTWFSVDVSDVVRGGAIDIAERALENEKSGIRLNVASLHSDCYEVRYAVNSAALVDLLTKNKNTVERDFLDHDIECLDVLIDSCDGDGKNETTSDVRVEDFLDDKCDVRSCVELSYPNEDGSLNLLF